jgi:hypothetical protein
MYAIDPVLLERQPSGGAFGAAAGLGSMHTLHDLPRAPAGRAVRAMLAAPALLSLAFLTGCVSPGAVLRQFGVVGTFAEDCSRGIDAGGARAIYDVPPSGYGYPTFTAVNRYGTFRSRIVRADRIGPNRLIMYVDDPSGTWNEIDMEKTANGFVTTRMVSHRPDTYRPIVAIGERGPRGNGGEGLVIERCSDLPGGRVPLSAQSPR